MEGESILSRILTFAKSQPKNIPFGPVSKKAIKEAEQTLDFAIPALLKSIYLNVGNGGFGPGYGLIGLDGGYVSDYGTLVETYNILKGGHEQAGDEWLPTLLPFCEWGCNIFSCVECNKSDDPVYLFREGDVTRQTFSLLSFFETWMKGGNLLSVGETEVETVEITNPFTRKKERVSRRRRKDK
jgi:hypothetical protein